MSLRDRAEDVAPGSAGPWSRRPAPDEFGAYYSRYMDGVPDGDVLRTLERGAARSRELLEAVPTEAETWRYAPGKWSVREVAGHVIDCERLFTFRAVHMARTDPTPLPDMDQELWARASNACDRPLAELLDELEAVREGTVHLFRGLAPEALDHRGVASGVEFTVRSLAWITAGHEIHHHRILEERYLPAIREGKESA